MADLSGRYFGRYHILEKIGQGGMASVYKALDARLERYVALKVINFVQESPDFLKRFEREAKALGQLNHPNIVGVIDYGEHEGTPFLVMEYLAGGTLKQRTGKAMPYSAAAHLLAPIARALDYAHSKKIVHRDVKPANILFNDIGTPMLTDFGIAKILAGDESMALTGTGVGMGTPDYMAPEQCNARTVDHRADIYALGILLYELVTGRTPYRANTPLAVALMHLTEPLPNPREFAPDLPYDVEKVILKALAKEPSERYATAADLALALEELAEEERTRRMAEERARRDSLEQATAIKPETGAAPAAVVVPGEQTATLQPPLESYQPPETPEQPVPELLAPPQSVSGLPAAPAQPVSQPETGLPVSEPIQPPSPPSVLPGEMAQKPVTTGKLPVTPALSAQPKKRRLPVWVFVIPGVLLVAIVATLGLSLLGTSLARPPSSQKAATATHLAGLTLTPGVADTQQPGVTPRVLSAGILNAANASQFVQVAQAGRGSIDKIFFSSDDRLMVIIQTTGVTVVDAQNGTLTSGMDLELNQPVSYAGDGKTFASSLGSGVAIWKVDSADPARAIQKVFELPTGSTSYVDKLVFTPDNQAVVAVFGDGEVDIWRLADGKLVYQIKDMTSYAQSVAVSANSSRLAASTIGADQKPAIYAWNLNNGQLDFKVQADAEIYQLCFSQDGQTLVSADYASKLTWWSLQDGRSSHEQQDRGEMVCSPAGNVLAVNLPEPGVEIWDITKGAVVSTLVIASSHASKPLSFSPNGTQLVTWTNERIQVWNVSDGKALWTNSGDWSGTPQVSYSSDSQLIEFTTGTWQVNVWNSQDGSLRYELPGFLSYPRIVLSPDGKTLASYSEDEARVAIWDVSAITMQKDRSPAGFLSGHSDTILSMAFSPDGDYLATSSYDNQIIIYNPHDRSEVVRLTGHEDTVNDVAFSPDGKLLASASSDKTVRLWKVSDWALVIELRGHQSSVESVTFSPDNSLLASWSSIDGTRLWRLSDFQPAGEFTEWHKPVFSPDARLVALESRDSSSLLVQKIADGSKYTLYCKNAVFSPDNSLLACANDDGQIILHSSDGKYLRTLEGWADPPFVFNSDGRLLVGVSGSEIVVWSVADGRQLSIWNGNKQYVSQLFLSPDNTFVVSCSYDGTIRVWGLPAP